MLRKRQPSTIALRGPGGRARLLPTRAEVSISLVPLTEEARRSRPESVFGYLVLMTVMGLWLREWKGVTFQARWLPSAQGEAQEKGVAASHEQPALPAAGELGEDSTQARGPGHQRVPGRPQG